MRATPRLKEATPTGDWKVLVGFEDGLEAEVDLSYLSGYGGVFRPLRDPEFFSRLRVYPEGDTIFWPNDADIAPETLYAHARRAAGVAA